MNPYLTEHTDKVQGKTYYAPEIHYASLTDQIALDYEMNVFPCFYPGTHVAQGKQDPISRRTHLSKYRA